MNLQEAAAYLGMTEAEIIRSRLRGLPPGNMGYRVEGELYFLPGDLLPPPECSQADEVGSGDEQTEIPTNEAVNPSGASDSPSGASDSPTPEPAHFFRLDDSDSLDRSGKLSDPLYCHHCQRLFSTASGKASHDRAKHGG